MATFQRLGCAQDYTEINRLQKVGLYIAPPANVFSGIEGSIQPNGHGKVTTPDGENRHARSLSPTLSRFAGEGANESLREFHVKLALYLTLSGIYQRS